MMYLGRSVYLPLGSTYGFLTTLSRYGDKDNTGRFICRCGREIDARCAKVASGHTTSCGHCALSSANTRHGLCRRGARHPLHVCWTNMKTRCYNPKCRYYKDYGGRGIEVCERWHSFDNFVADMFPSWKPGLTIEREKNDMHYSPGNCVWATRKVQANNRRPARRLGIVE